ncbi:MAG: hypothetical protein IPP17_11545 [Bacteroidetes bacterium]|nr:hypothetical protein [Bacteroidota bacterium]
MNSDNVLSCLLLMMFLGPIQVLVALTWAIGTEFRKTRKHLLFYLGGVLAYFIGLGIMNRPFHDIYHFPTYQLYYIGGAGLLATYHVIICISGRKMP